MSPSIHSTPDTEQGLTQSLGRFLVPTELVDAVQLPMIIRQARLELTTADRAFRQYVKKAGNDLVQANLKRKWHFRGDLGIEVDRSELQVDFYDFGGAYASESAAKDQHTLDQDHNQVACVIKMWFVAPKVQALVTSNDEVAESDGFVRNMPQPGTIADVGPTKEWREPRGQ